MSEPPRSPQTYPLVGGVLGRAADAFSRRSREARVRHFRDAMGVEAGTQVLDVGCGSLGVLALAPELDVTGVDLLEQPDYPRRLVVADASHGLPFDDDAFDVAFCNSVIEHVAPARRAAFAAEVRRVARGWYVQTPALAFPIEPHSLLPGAHWLPVNLRRLYWRLGVASDVEGIRLLRRRELEALFGPAVRERLGPLTKSWIAVRPPG